MKTFSFRAECARDVKQLRKTIKHQNLQVHVREVALSFGEVAVELKTEVDMADIVHAMQGQDDSHVMIETLREVPIEGQKFERTYSGWPEGYTPERAKASIQIPKLP